jgi:acyl-CoA synthetase (AMP-forming)/AMP-acid ligase II
LHKHVHPVSDLQVDAVTGETRTFSNILMRSLSVAECLRARGVKVGDAVAICSENSLDYILPVFATYYIGAICAPLNPNFTARKYQCIYDRSQRIIQGVPGGMCQTSGECSLW